MRIGILGTAEIAFRRFLPALEKCPTLEYVGVATRTPEKAEPFRQRYGGQIYDGYDALLEDKRIEAVYVPLPPALHYEWGKKALCAGKHLLMEKPFATSPDEAEELLALAAERDLAVHENYMFLYHGQLANIRSRIADGGLGELRLIRVSFGFPKRSADDFRYNRSLGGGALLDCGGYPLRLARELLGDTARVTQAQLAYPAGYEVDLYGSAVLENAAGLCAQIGFGMDNAYQCQLEVWGSRMTLLAPRIFTAGPDFEPPLILRSSTGEERIAQKPDDQFLGSIQAFVNSIAEKEQRAEQRKKITRQMEFVQLIRLWRG